MWESLFTVGPSLKLIVLIVFASRSLLSWSLLLFFLSSDWAIVLRFVFQRLHLSGLHARCRWVKGKLPSTMLAIHNSTHGNLNLLFRRFFSSMHYSTSTVKDTVKCVPNVCSFLFVVWSFKAFRSVRKTCVRCLWRKTQHRWRGWCGEREDVLRVHPSPSRGT